MAASPSQPKIEPSFHRNLAVRILTAFVAIPLVVIPLWFGGLWFSALVGVIGVMLAYEWHQLVGSRWPFSWLAGGYLLIGLVLYSLWEIRMDSEYGLYHALYFLLAIWVTDTFAFFVGKTLKGPKLWPKISPRKTWSGFIGGVLTCCVFSLSWSLNFPDLWPEPRQAAYFGLLFGALAQAGDMSISRVKRLVNVKDSGWLFPGHGGILDRMDGFLYTAPLYFFLIKGLAQ